MLPLASSSRGGLASLALATSLAATGCGGGKATAADCAGLVRRYAETLVDRERAGLSRGARERLIEEAIASAQASPAFRECPQRISQSSIACARDAWDPDQVERCLIAVP